MRLRALSRGLRPPRRLLGLGLVGLSFALATAGMAQVQDKPLAARQSDAEPLGFKSAYAPIKDYWWEPTYFEAFDLPAASNGPSDATLSPDGRRILLAARGWIWLLDLSTRRATRVTATSSVDSQPAWSADGREIAFVRDTGHDTAIILKVLATGSEQTVNTPAIELNPAYSADGKSLFYSSSVAGDLDIWKLDIKTGSRERITSERGLELRPTPLPDGRSIIYLARTPVGKIDELRLRNLQTGSERVLKRGYALSQTRFAVSPDGLTLAFTWPDEERWSLQTLSILDPGPSYQLLTQDAPPLSPSWFGGDRLAYSQWTASKTPELMSLPAAGGSPSQIPVTAWDWGAPVGNLRLEISTPNRSPAPARVSISDEAGHPVFGESGPTRLDPQNGLYYFYTDGSLRLTLPAGLYLIRAAQGLTSPETVTRVDVRAGAESSVRVALKPVWDAAAAGYLSGDHHFHMNYGGPFVMRPDDLAPMMAGEALDVATPLIANLHTRLLDRRWKDWSKTDSLPFVQFSQEVRSGLSGHLSVVGRKDLFFPSFFGPRDAVFTRSKLSNSDVLEASKDAAFVAYAHPTLSRNPLEADDPHALPTELIPDAILGDPPALEVVCIWSDELGTSELWSNLLNLGIPMVPSAGTDAFLNFQRSMALGTARIYVHVANGGHDLATYYRKLREGRSFVTNGPIALLTVAGHEPGEVLAPTSARQRFRVDLHTAAAVDRVEVLVNGKVAWRTQTPAHAGSWSYTGRLALPPAGWISVRAVGARTTWPSMDAYLFAQSAPIWIGRRGSADPASREASAAALLKVIDGLILRTETAYQQVGLANAKPVARLLMAKRCLTAYSHAPVQGAWSCKPGE